PYGFRCAGIIADGQDPRFPASQMPFLLGARYSLLVATAVHTEPKESAGQFCWRALDDVSRSFAAVIRQLPPSPAEAVMVSYLLCRIADSIEDSSLPLAERQSRLRRLAAQLERNEVPQFVPASVPPV